MAFWNDLFRQRAESWTLVRFEPQQVPGVPARAPIVPDSHYLTMVLKSCRIVDVRKGFTRFYGMVHSSISVQHAAGQPASFQTVTTPSSLKDVDAAHIDRIVQLDHKLIGPVPYRGENLDLEIGLFSVPSADLTAPYLTLLESLSKTAGVSFISAAMPFVGPIRDGINLLLGGSNATILEIGLASSYWEPKTGYYAVLRSPKGAIDPSTLRIDMNDFKLIASGGHSLAEVPYLVFEVTASERRDDWFNIPDLKQAYDAFRAALLKNDMEEASELLAVFKRTALLSFDLLKADARRLVALVEQEFQELSEVVPKSADDVRSFAELPLYTEDSPAP